MDANYQTQRLFFGPQDSPTTPNIGLNAPNVVDLGPGDSLLAPSGDLAASGASLALAEFHWSHASLRLELGIPIVGANDGGILIADGIVRIGTGLQSYGVGLGAVIGNARGAGAVDLQFTRTAATQIAAGAASAIVGGVNHTASAGQAGIVGGRAGVASGNRAGIVGGDALTASGSESGCFAGTNNDATSTNATCTGGTTSAATANNAATLGGRDNIASATASIAMGIGSRATHIGEVAISSTSDNVAGGADGRAQLSSVTWIRRTTDAAAATMFLDGAATEFDVPLNTIYHWSDLKITAKNNAANESACWRVADFAIQRTAGAPAFVGGVAPVAAVTVADAGAATWVVVISISGNNLRITITGEAGKTIVWSAGGTALRGGLY
jgi:hypothetical protein